MHVILTLYQCFVMFQCRSPMKCSYKILYIPHNSVMSFIDKPEFRYKITFTRLTTSKKVKYSVQIDFS